MTDSISQAFADSKEPILRNTAMLIDALNAAFDKLLAEPKKS